MSYIKPFNELNKNDAHLAGGKGASLGEMTQAGIPVPPGFVILSTAFDQFLAETDVGVEIDSILRKVNPEAIHTVEYASEAIKALILAASVPEDIAQAISTSFATLGAAYVAVRSSATAEDGATAAWAGQLESYLNTTEKTLHENVKKCWASLFTPRAIFYRFEKGLHELSISVAVVVQTMVQSEIAGIAFSVHPVTEDQNQMIIEAGYGLGEAIVSGQITPDSYVVDKQLRRIIDTNIAEQEKGLYLRSGENEWQAIPQEKQATQKLTEQQILSLADLVLTIEEHYDFPCDIEWTFQNGAFYIVQSRPITTLSNKNELSTPSLESGKGVRATPDQLWEKNWEGKFSLLLSIISLSGYGESMQEIFGISIPQVMLTHRHGITACYLNPTQLSACGAFLYATCKKDPKLVRKWSDALKQYTDEINHFAQLSDTTLIQSGIVLNLIASIKIFSAYQIATKEIANHLDDQELFALLAEARLYSEHVYFSLDDLLGRVLRLLPQQSTYSLEQLSCLTSQELESIVAGGRLPASSDLGQRYECSGVKMDQDLFLLDAQTVELFEQSLVASHDDNRILGTTAYPGKATGRVRVVRDFHGVILHPGDILVTGMTDPNYVPLMQQAGAIVTDAGGILCHAAIISRELGKPCVIGTKIATQVLKDGDLVEVDADNGVIKIIQSVKDSDTTSNQEVKKNVEAKLSQSPSKSIWMNGVEWGVWASRNISLWHDYLMDEGFFWHLKDFGLNIQLHIMMIIHEGTQTTLLVNQSNLKQFEEEVIKLVQDKAKIVALKKIYHTYGQSLVDALEACKKKLSRQTWEKFSHELRRYSAGLIVTTAIGRSGLELFTKHLRDIEVPEHTFDDVISTITYPDEHTPLFASQVDLLEIGKRIQLQEINERGKVEAINAWLAAYGYIPVNFCENPWDGDDAKRQLENALQLDCAAELRQLKKSHHDRIEKRDAMLKKIQDPFVTDIAYALAEGTTLNEYRKNIFSKVSLEYRGIFEELARRGNSEHWRDCFYLLPQEMGALASGEIVPIESLKKERQVFCFLPDANGRIQIVDSEQTAHLLEWIQTLHGAKSAATLSASGHDNQKELKGFSACSGVYRGTVKVLLSRKDFSKLNSGDVLVTTMTSVDFIPVMKQAGAFVTNEGGITSHAAIVSREMNKPCIIGTKIATQALKDGDLVEVDANSGVVRIIKK